ncbi:MAG: GspB domain-containing protein [Xanthomonadales bacterium]|nr:GspB domain-containing protein [Xanthomonadales bacterium]
MSYLLDALRKSEDLKKQGSAPTIHAAEHHARQAGTPRWVGLILLVLLPLLLLLAWYGWTGREPQAESQAEAAAAGESAQPSEPALMPGAASVGPADPDRSVSAGPSTDSVRLTIDRTPVERLESPAEASQLDRQATSPDESLSDAQASAVTMERPQNPPTAPSTESVSNDPARLTNDQDSQSHDFQPARPGLIHVWELPESVRSDLVEMKISVLVFAERAEDRFILMNGKRWIEGDEPQQGLVIREIRREGVVFSYRLYQFLVSR